jgi:predicted nucleic acid-binding protein
LYLVDTSVWIDFFRARPTAAVERLKALLTAGVETGVCPPVLQEILQGTTDQRHFEQYRSYFETQPIHRSNDPIRSAIAAAQMYFDCRRQGITVRSSNDCLIAQTALEHGLILLHDDKDFRRIGRVFTELREVSS